MALYLGDTEVSPVIEVPVPEKRFNTGVNNLLGTVDENGVYAPPTEPFTPDFSNVKVLRYHALYYKFYNNSGVVGDVVFGFESISGERAMYGAFQYCSNLASALFPQLTTISGTGAMQGAFQSCTKLTSASFPALTTVSGNAVMNGPFFNCSNLASVSFPQLTTISGATAMAYAFNNCAKLTSVSFPALKEILPEATQDQFTGAFNNCTALAEIHFPAAMRARVEQLGGYTSKWGAPTSCSILFDL